MELFVSDHIGELLMAAVLGLFGWGFKSWSNNIGATSAKILEELKGLTKEFHQHRIDVERRVTRVETKVDLIRNDVEDISNE